MSEIPEGYADAVRRMARKKPPVGRDLAGLIRAVVRERGEQTPVMMLADELQARGDPAHKILLRWLAGERHPWTRAIVPLLPDPWQAAYTNKDRASAGEPGESVTTKHRLTAYRRVYPAPNPRDDRTGEPYPAIEVGFTHTEPPPEKKVWNGSRSAYRGFEIPVTHAEARDFLDAHPDAAFRRAGHAYLDRHLGPDPREKE